MIIVKLNDTVNSRSVSNFNTLRIIQYYLLLTILAFSVRAVHAQNDATAELKMKAPKQWEKYIVALAHMEGHIDRECKWVDQDGTSTQSDSYNIAYCHPWTANDSEKSAVVYGKNYNFSLKKNVGGWVIEKLNRNSFQRTTPRYPPVTEEPGIDRSSLVVANQLGVGLQIVPNFIYLPSIWNKPEFEILSAVPFDSGEERLIDVSFRFAVKPPHLYAWIAPPDKDFTIDGKLTLGTDYYLVRRSEIDCDSYDEEGKFTEHLTWEIEYDFQKDEVPLPVYSKHTSEGNGLSFTEVKRFSLNRMRKPDPSRFTLSHYGFPEPDFKNQRLSVFRLVLVLLGCIFITYAVLRALNIRRAKSQESE